MQQAFGIFEGGGGKGLAHVGALRCALDNGIEFIGVAGASAGAIVSSLVACGYQPRELFDPGSDDSDAIYAAGLKTILGFTGPEEWERFERAVEALQDVLPRKNAKWPRLGLAWRGLRFARRHREVMQVLARHRGIFDTRALEIYLNERLVAGLLKNHPERAARAGFTGQPGQGKHRRVLFKDVPLPLKIVATDIDRKRLIVFSQELTPGFPVVDAVAASISLPIVFRPKQLRYPGWDDIDDTDSIQVRAIDGGLLSNFPAWLFDKERGRLGPHVPTLGFRLVETETRRRDELSSLAAYLLGVVDVVLNGDPLLETREIENLHEIPLKVSCSMLDFDLSHEQKCALYEEGRTSALEALGQPGFPRDRAEIESVLADVIELFREIFELPPPSMLRANLVCLTTRQTLRVTYTCNMDTPIDSDDRLEFSLESGAVGECWNQAERVACDLVDARTNSKWKMDKYQQALVRQDLKALLCFPIFDADGTALAVLNIDSTDAAILEIFGRADIEARVGFHDLVNAQVAELLNRQPREG
jgi:NTE family protein